MTPHFLSLQYDCDAAASVVVRSGDGKQLEVRAAAGSTVKDLPKIKDITDIKLLVSGHCFSFHLFSHTLQKKCFTLMLTWLY